MKNVKQNLNLLEHHLLEHHLLSNHLLEHHLLEHHLLERHLLERHLLQKWNAQPNMLFSKLLVQKYNMSQLATLPPLTQKLLK